MNLTLYGSTQSRLPSPQPPAAPQNDPAQGRGGVHVLRAHAAPALPGLPAHLRVRRYRDAVTWLLAHRARLACAAGAHPTHAAESLIGWIFDPRAALTLFAPSLEAEGLPLRSIVFLESHLCASTLQSACELDAFQAIVVEGLPTPAALQTARRWTKPTALRADGEDPSCALRARAREGRTAGALQASATGALGALGALGAHGVLRADAHAALAREKLVLFLH